MQKEFTGTIGNLSDQIDTSLRGVAIFLPIFVGIFGALVNYRIFEGSPLFSISSWIAVLTLVTVLSIMMVVIKKASVVVSAFYLIAYHAVLAVELLYIFGINSPIAATWSLLILATVILYGLRWAVASYMTLAVVMYIYTLLIDVGPNEIASILFSLVIQVMISAVFIGIYFAELDERKKLLRSNERGAQQRDAMVTIINGTTQPIFTANARGKIRIYNAAFLNLIDTNSSLTGKSVDEALPLFTLDDKPFSLHEAMAKQGHVERDDVIFKFNDGDQMRLHLSGNKVLSAFSAKHHTDNDGFIFMARDITKEKSLEEERDEFVSVVSHELRTPIAITEGTISNLQYLIENKADPKKLNSSLTDAHEQILLLSRMVNDLGTLSRAERGVGDELESIDVKELAEDLYNKYVGSAKDKGLSLNLDAPGKLGTVITSRLYLEEMLQNFITNSIKYTKKGSVTITIKASKNTVNFAVSDTGIGISKSDLNHIFEKFYRSEDFRTRETSGTGLGLYVTHKLMKKLGTKIDVKSRLNHGSSFSFSLPLEKPKK